MAIPQKKKRGIRLLTHEGISYYWKVKNNYEQVMLHVLIGLEDKPSFVFSVDVDFVDPGLYFPWFATAHEQGRDMTKINGLEKVSPKFIVSAIDFARETGWPEQKALRLLYKQGVFQLETN